VNRFLSHPLQNVAQDSVVGPMIGNDAERLGDDSLSVFCIPCIPLVLQRILSTGTFMMIRTLFTLSFLALVPAVAFAAGAGGDRPVIDVTQLVQTQGLGESGLVQAADDEMVEEAVQDNADIATDSASPAAKPADGGYPEPAQYDAPVVNQRYYSAPRRKQSGGVFSELMELERRKNAWLKRTFLGM